MDPHEQEDASLCDLCQRIFQCHWYSYNTPDGYEDWRRAKSEDDLSEPESLHHLVRYLQESTK
jgi:hypothetical protein